MHIRISLWLVFIGSLVFQANVAFARAGGGGGYSSGGSSSSSSSYSGGSSSSGGGSSTGSGEFTIIDGILLIAIIGFAIYSHRKLKAKLAEQARHKRLRSEEIAGVIRERDPEFDLDAFNARIARAFTQIQAAWSAQDLEPVRGFMSDGLHERFSIQLREQKALGYRNQLSDVRIHESTLIESHASSHFDVVSVRITASATDFRVDLANEKPLTGSLPGERFTEVWSFLRGRVSTSDSGDGLFEGQCPNCATPIDPKRAWTCLSCASDLESAPPDWVLTEITQQCEWSRRETREKAWLKQATQRDPGLTEQQIEDRASVLFWRLMDSERTGRVDELATIARPSFLEAQRGRLAAAGDRYLGECAVGAVSLRGIIAGREWDVALAEIRWSGALYHRRADKNVEEPGSQSLRRSLLVMVRRSHAQSTIGRCIVSAHCIRCGAADEGALDGSCSFCGEPMNDGSDWILDRFLSMKESEAIMLLADVHRPTLQASSIEPFESNGSQAAELDGMPGGTELFAWSLRLVYADQNFDPRERDALAKLAKRMGIPEREARKMRQAAQFGRLEVAGPADPQQAERWLREIESLAKADGPLNRHERRVLAQLSDRC